METSIDEICRIIVIVTYGKKNVFNLFYFKAIIKNNQYLSYLL